MSVFNAVHFRARLIQGGCGGGGRQDVPPFVGMVVHSTNTSWEWERLRVILTVEGKWIMEVATFLHPPHPVVISQTHP